MKLVRKATPGEQARYGGQVADIENNDAETQVSSGIFSAVLWVVSALAIVVIFASLGGLVGNLTPVRWVHQAGPMVGAAIGIVAAVIVQRTVGLRTFGWFAIAILAAVIAYRIWKG